MGNSLNRGAFWLLSLLPLSLAILTPASARAQAPQAPVDLKAYTIANYPIEARDKNAVAAKKRAIAEGQQAAFRSLLKRIVPVSAYTRLDRVKAANAGDYISGISVRHEENSGTEYIATLDFVFSAEATRRLLQTEGVPFIDEPAPTITLVPVFQAANGKRPTPGLGDWGETWRSLDLVNSVTPVRVSGLRASVSEKTLKALAAGDASVIRNLSTEYGQGPIVFAFAQPDAKAGKLNVMLVGRDGAGSLKLKQRYPLAPGDLPYAMEYGAVVSLAILEGRWKATRARSRGGLDVISGPGIPTTLQVQFDNPGQWYQIQDRLRGLTGVADLKVAGVSARSADVTLTFPGGGAQLANVLARQGLSLRDAGGVWVLRSSY